VFRSCSGSANCGVEHAVQWRGVMYVGTKLGGKETQPDVIHFITILPLKVLGCFEITLLHVHRPPMVLYRFKINKDQI
jgi:hypothetical protein